MTEEEEEEEEEEAEGNDILLRRDRENYSNIGSQEGTPLHSGKGRKEAKESVWKRRR